MASWRKFSGRLALGTFVQILKDGMAYMRYAVNNSTVQFLIFAV